MKFIGDKKRKRRGIGTTIYSETYVNLGGPNFLVVIGIRIW